MLIGMWFCVLKDFVYLTLWFMMISFRRGPPKCLAGFIMTLLYSVLSSTHSQCWMHRGCYPWYWILWTGPSGFCQTGGRTFYKSSAINLSSLLLISSIINYNCPAFPTTSFTNLICYHLNLVIKWPLKKISGLTRQTSA